MPNLTKEQSKIHLRDRILTVLHECYNNPKEDEVYAINIQCAIFHLTEVDLKEVIYKMIEENLVTSLSEKNSILDLRITQQGRWIVLDKKEIKKEEREDKKDFLVLWGSVAVIVGGLYYAIEIIKNIVKLFCLLHHSFCHICV